MYHGPAPGGAPLARLIRHEWAAWLALGGILAAAWLLLIPRLDTQFRFRELFPAGHPARVAYEDFQENFGQGSRIFLYFHGPEVFRAPFLGAVNELGHRLRRLPDSGGAFSAVDLAEPRIRGRNQILTRILREEVLEDPAELAEALARPPLKGFMEGFLYDRARKIYVVVVTPPLDDSDPVASRAFMAAVDGAARDFAREQGVEVHLGGDFYLRHEVRRVALESQVRVTSVAFALLALLFWGLFGSPLLVVMVFLLLGISVFLSFSVMALMEVPVTFLSVNTAIMVLVIGTADLVHIAGRYCAARLREEPTEAAIRASRETALPVLLTSLTTAGCMLMTAVTPLNLVRQFALALATGVMVTWALAVTFGPLLLRRSGVVPGRGLYFRIHGWLGRALEGRTRRRLRGAAVPLGFALATLVCLVLISRQEVNSNWFRSFGPEQPMARTLDFLDRRAFPRSTVDCTLLVDLRLQEALADPALERDVRKIAALLARQPGVLGVEHLYTQLDWVRDLVRRVRYPPEIAPRWRETRRAGILRQYVAGGLFERYFGGRRHQLRLVALTGFEASADFQRLKRRVLREVRGLELEVAKVEDFEVGGQMHYWSAIMDIIPRTFLWGLLGCLFLIYACFLVVTGSPSLSLLALAPNLFPLVVMFGVGWLFSIPLNENLILSMSLAIGVAVDDTLHFLHHYRQATVRGESALDAAQEAMVTAGAPIVVTSLLLVVGFGVCLGSTMTPLRQMGVLLCLAISSALVADLLLLPALLLRFDRPTAPGQDRGYELERLPSR